MRLGLAPAVTGAVIAGVEVFDTRALTRHDGDAHDFEARLRGRTILGAARRGKFLWMPLAPVVGGSSSAGPLVPASCSVRAASPSEALVGHLGMSGQLLLRDRAADNGRHLRVRVALEHPEHGELRVDFVDQRTFGSLAIDTLVPTSDDAAAGWGTEDALVPSQVAHIARDPLDSAFVDAGLVAALARKNSAIKRVLLDQTVVSGVGNIYADEALWAARIHPETRASALSTRAVNRLLGEVRAVLNRALAEGGTSFDAQYVNVNGEAGYFARSLNVYGRAGEPCSRCGVPVKRISFANRGSHLCPRCQRRS